MIEFARESKEIDDITSRVHELDLLAESRSLDDSEVSELKEGRLKLIKLQRFKKLDLKQKALIKWTIDGEENTSFFHRSLKNKIGTTEYTGSQLTVHGLLTQLVSKMKR